MKRATGLVLCGGKSSRMGRDKAFLDVEGKPLLQLQIERLEEAGCDEVLISGPYGRGYEAFGKSRVTDILPDSGPMAGIGAGLAAAKNEWILAVAVDLPKASPEFFRRLLDRSAEKIDAVCAQNNVGYEPLCAAYRKSCLAELRRRLDARLLSLQDLLAELRRNERLDAIPPEEWTKWGEDLFRNWNDKN